MQHRFHRGDGSDSHLACGAGMVLRLRRRTRRKQLNARISLGLLLRALPHGHRRLRSTHYCRPAVATHVSRVHTGGFAIDIVVLHMYVRIVYSSLFSVYTAQDEFAEPRADAVSVLLLLPALPAAGIREVSQVPQQACIHTGGFDRRTLLSLCPQSLRTDRSQSRSTGRRHRGRRLRGASWQAECYPDLQR